MAFGDVMTDQKQISRPSYIASHKKRGEGEGGEVGMQYLGLLQ